jgi:3-hydroxyacyl-[acyl-carrier-protein] dehydratase
MMIEAMAQTAALLSFLTVGKKLDANDIVYFAGIDGARFKRPVGPGDQLRMEVEIVRAARGIWKYKAKALVEGQLVVEADLMCTMRSAADASPPAEQ